MKNFILWFLLSCSTFSVYAAEYSLKPSAIHRFDTNNGLISNEITCFIQDDEGFMWIGTTNGLSRFDGYDFKTYKSNYLSPHFFTGNSIRCMAKDRNGRLFLGMSSGLNIFDLRTGKVKQYPIEKMKCDIINSIAITSSNTVYIGTAIGVLRFNEKNGTFTNVKRDAKGNEIKGNYIQSLFIDSRNVMWIGMWHTGFCALDLNENKFYTYPEIVTGRQLSITSFYEDANNDIWLSSWNEEGVFRLKNPLQKDTFESTEFPIKYDNKSATSNPSIYGIVQDKRQGYIWIATSDGLKLITDPDNPSSVVSYRNIDLDGTMSNEISSIYIDRTGVIWYSMYGAACGLLDLNKRDFSEYFFPELKLNKEIVPITSVYQDENGLLWLGIKTLNLLLFDPQIKKTYRYFNMPVLKGISPQSNSIMGFARHSKRNELWLATRYYGLYVVKLKDNRPASLVHLDEKKLKSPNTNKVIEGLNGLMWVATSEGVNYIEPGLFGDYVCQKSDLIDKYIGKTAVNTFWFDKKQILWIGTQDNGIFKVMLNHNGTPKSIRQYDIGNSRINNNNIVCIYCDAKNRIWIGTHGGGLSLYNHAKDRFEVIDNMNFMPDDVIYSIEEDKFGRLWLTTGKGLVCYNYDFPRERQIRVFSSDDNLSVNSFSAGASFKGKNGELYFGGANGLLWFSPTGFQDNTFSPTPIVTDIFIENKSISDLAKEDGRVKLLPPYTREVRLSYKDNSIRIEFASLSYGNLSSKTYAYKLEGFDTDWIRVNGKNRYAVYNNLKKGNYTFLIKSYNEDGYTNNRYATLEIIKEPAPWETIWAYLLYLCAASLLVYFIFRFLINRMNFKRTLKIEQMERSKSEEVHQAKLQFFTNISHELFTPITVLSCSLDDLAAQYPRDMSYIRIMKLNLNRLMRLLQQILEFRKSETGNLKLKVSQGNIAMFINEICEVSFYPLMKSKQIHLDYRVEPNVLIGYFDTDKMDKIIYNLLSNAYKYNVEGGKIGLDVRKELVEGKNFIVIKVKDTGPGIEPEKLAGLFKRFYEGDYRRFNTKGTGIGLSLTKDLVTLHNGTISVASEVGKGTEFTVRIPIDASAYTAEQIDSKEDILLSAQNPDIAIKSENLAVANPDKDISVLIVEDNEDLLTVLGNVLSQDFEVFKALNGKESLKMLEQTDIDIVVTDYIMPEMDGIELTKFMKKELVFSHIPIILLTVKQSTNDKIIGFEAGADAYITKPFEVKLLVANIKSLVRNRREISASFSGKDQIKLSQFTYNSVDKDFLDKAMRVVEERVKVSDFNASDFYEAMNMSQPTLYRKIKSITNLSPNEFIRNVKFKLACKLLLERELNISEVAYKLGFSDSRYFSTVFKKEIGMSPSEYVRRNKKG